jgi:hypothetical protein
MALTPLQLRDGFAASTLTSLSAEERRARLLESAVENDDLYMEDVASLEVRCLQLRGDFVIQALGWKLLVSYFGVIRRILTVIGLLLLSILSSLVVRGQRPERQH